MQIPSRRGERNNLKKNDYHYTEEMIAKFKRELVDLEKTQLPRAAAEVQRTGAFGDFSENAEYQYAKAGLRRILDKISTLRRQINNAIPISKMKSDQVSVGSTISLATAEKKMIYQIVGSAETDPKKGRISYLSDLGQALLGKKENDTVQIKTQAGQVSYTILKID
jgi:transcription elongation factor GreA